VGPLLDLATGTPPGRASSSAFEAQREANRRGDGDRPTWLAAVADARRRADVCPRDPSPRLELALLLSADPSARAEMDAALRAGAALADAEDEEERRLAYETLLAAGRDEAATAMASDGEDPELSRIRGIYERRSTR
jgi:hypothetical protein